MILVEPCTISTPIWDKAIAYLDDLVGSESVRLAPYRDRLHVFRERLHSADEHGKPAADVAEVIAKTLTEEHPDTRYVVGAGGRLATALRPLIPDRLAARVSS